MNLKIPSAKWRPFVMVSMCLLSHVWEISLDWISIFTTVVGKNQNFWSHNERQRDARFIAFHYNSYLYSTKTTNVMFPIPLIHKGSTLISNARYRHEKTNPSMTKKQTGCRPPHQSPVVFVFIVITRYASNVIWSMRHHRHNQVGMGVTDGLAPIWRLQPLWRHRSTGACQGASA